MSLLTKLWRLITLRCITCGSEEHLWHRRSAIPRAWVIDGLAMAPGPDTLYRAVLDEPRCDFSQGHPFDCSCDKVDDPSMYARGGTRCDQCGEEGHYPHKCQMIGWCHDCDGSDCGGGCRDDAYCAKRQQVIQTGIPGRVLFPDEWTKRGEQ